MNAAEWNAVHPPGTVVDWILASGEVMATKTRGLAYWRSSGLFVVEIDGASHPVLLSHLRPHKSPA